MVCCSTTKVRAGCPCDRKITEAYSIDAGLEDSCTWEISIQAIGHARDYGNAMADAPTDAPDILDYDRASGTVRRSLN